MKMEFSLESMCRTCMNEDRTMFSVFTLENSGISAVCYADMLMACASLHIDRDDELPHQICQHCLKHLSIAYSFKQQCERSEATLREITKDPHIEFIKEEILNDSVTGDNYILGDQDRTVETEINLDESITGDVSPVYKLTEEFLEDEFMGEGDLSELRSVKNYSKPKLKSDIKKEDIYNQSDELETEYLDDEFVLDNFESESTNITEETENVAEKINIKKNKINLVYDLETLRKAVLKPKASSVDYKSQLSTNLDLDRLRKSVLTPKSKPGTRILNKELKCPYCDQTFRTQQFFKKHKKQHLKKLKCELCCKEFRSTHGLRYHMKIHNGIKNYACNFENCTKRFRLKQALDKHLSIHNNEKNFLCAICGKIYSTYDALHYHLKAHRGERPYLCIHCGKTFKQSCHLKSHMWVHSGIKPHVCNRCGKCYTSGHQLKKHMKKHCPPIVPTTAEALQEIVDDVTNEIVNTDIITTVICA